MQTFTAIGRLTNDPTISQTNGGTAVCKFSLAVERNRANADSERESDFFNTIVYGKVGENCGKYLKKGSQIAVVGSVETRSYNAQDGSKRYITELIAERVQFLSTGSGTNKQGNKPANTPPELEEIDTDDLPF